MKNDFSRRLRKAREAKGLSQVELGSMVGADPIQISRYENGRHEPKGRRIKDLEDALGMKRGDLLAEVK